jgi:succinate dehydrogenase hydrophobic anchor subunit
MSQSDVARAEWMSRKRANLFFFSAALFIFMSMVEFPAHSSVAFAVTWVVWAALLLVNLAGIGGWLCPPGARALSEDETTKAHRAKALSIGFFVAIGVALFLSIFVRFVPLDAREVAMTTVTAGISCALISFAAQERLAMRDA